MTRRSPAAQRRYCLHVAGVFGRCLLVVAALAVAAQFGGDGATLVRQAAGMSHLTVEARWP